jgi:hypothetical protein
MLLSSAFKYSIFHVLWIKQYPFLYWLFLLFPFSYCLLPIFLLAISLFNQRINEWNFADTTLVTIILNVCLIMIIISHNLTYLWLFGIDNNIFSYIYILQRNSASDIKHVNFRTTGKAINTFYIPEIYCC